MSYPIVHLIGVEGPGKFSAQVLELIRTCRALVLSGRHRSMLAATLGDLPAARLIPIAPVQDALAHASQELSHGDVVVLASGDPLFFGIGRTLLQFFGPDRIAVYPALSSMQIAFARFKIPWDDAGFLSLHGRETQNPAATAIPGFHGIRASMPVAAALLVHDKLFLFTDRTSSPDRIARSLLTECGSGINAEYVVHVAENLGMGDERLHTGTLTEIAESTFSALNVMILVKRSGALPAPCFGLSEEEISHSRGLITKNEVRAASLHELRLPPQGVLWDVGAGSGSVGLEAARLFPGLQVMAVEREKEQIENINRNREQFHTWNLQLIKGSAPDALAALPAPDRVFIGGSGGRLRAIIDHAVERLNPGGRIVVNAVLEKTSQEAPEFLHARGLEVTLSEIRVRRRRYPEEESQAMHPITIIVGRKKNKAQEKTDE